jgi:hypothetical protein
MALKITVGTIFIYKPYNLRCKIIKEDKTYYTTKLLNDCSKDNAAWIIGWEHLWTKSSFSSADFTIFNKPSKTPKWL